MPRTLSLLSVRSESSQKKEPPGGRRLWAALLAGALLACGPDKDMEEEEGPEDEEEEEGGPGLSGSAFINKVTSGEEVTLEQFRRAAEQAEKITETLGSTWQGIGPTNVGGRVPDLAIDPKQPNTLYIASAGGGVWKSTDAGDTFGPVWPSDNVQAMGALALGPDGTLWAGTGEANPPGGGITYFGNGIYKSTDGALTWQQVGLKESGAVGRIIVVPTDPARLFVAAAGTLYAPGGERGIYRTINAGKDWVRVLAPPNDTTGGIELAIDPKNPRRLFAALWDHKRTPFKRTYGGAGSGLYRSDDGGDTWSRLEKVTSLSSGDTTGLRSSDTLGRIAIAVAPSDPRRVYVLTATQYGDDKGFYVSNDGGDSFAAGGRAGGGSGFAWWFGRLWVDPKDKDHLFSADVSLRESVNGGRTWATSSGPHADQHALQWDPNVPNRVYLGNDGGIYRSERNGASGSWIHDSYLPNNQLYHVDIAADEPKRIVNGLQDQGGTRTWTRSMAPADQSRFNSFVGGDGHFSLIDPSNHNIYYGCSQNGSCIYVNDTAGTTQSLSGGTHSIRWNTDTPIAIAPYDPQVLYYAGNALDRSTNRGSSWTRISPVDANFLTGTFGSPDEVDPKYPNWGTTTAVGLAKTDSKTIYLGTDTGRLWITTNLGTTWTQFTDPTLPKRWVTAIAVDPADARHVFVTFSGFRNGEEAANVFMSKDSGTTWTNISSNLPNAPVNTLIYDQPKDNLYVGTDLGVYILESGLMRWQRFGSGLPVTPTEDLKLHAATHTLYAATFGRSIWKIPAL